MPVQSSWSCVCVCVCTCACLPCISHYLRRSESKINQCARVCIWYSLAQRSAPTMIRAVAEIWRYLAAKARRKPPFHRKIDFASPSYRSWNSMFGGRIDLPCFLIKLLCERGSFIQRLHKHKTCIASSEARVPTSTTFIGIILFYSRIKTALAVMVPCWRRIVNLIACYVTGW